MAIGKAKRVIDTFLKQEVDGLDVKLMFGLFQRKVIAYDERAEDFRDFEEKMVSAKKWARKKVKKTNPEKTYMFQSDHDEAQPRTDAHVRFDFMDRSGTRLARKDSTNLSRDVVPADLIDNPIVFNGYNMNFDPYASN